MAVGDNSKEPFDSLLKDYSAIQQQLAHDKTDRLKDSINDFDSDIHVTCRSRFPTGQSAVQFMEDLKELDEATEQAFQANDLEAARIQFGKISAALITLLSDYRPPLTQDVEGDDVSDVEKITRSMASNGTGDSQSVHRNRDVQLRPNIGSIGDNELKAVR